LPCAAQQQRHTGEQVSGASGQGQKHVQHVRQQLRCSVLAATHTVPICAASQCLHQASASVGSTARLHVCHVWW
jgi:hypothetical protein